MLNVHPQPKWTKWENAICSPPISLLVEWESHLVCAKAWIATKFMSHMLTDKQNQVNVYQDFKETFPSFYITGNKTWVCGYNPEMKQQSSQ
jgi:hypothetical protein